MCMYKSNKSVRIRRQEHIEVMWQWKNEDGEWKLYKQPVSNELEIQYQLKQSSENFRNVTTKIRTGWGVYDYIINLNTMKQTNKKTKLKKISVGLHQ
eukprot:UN26512